MPHRVLVIEDEDFWWKVFQTALEREGMDVESERAEDSQSALDIVGEKDFDVVLLDVIMPPKLAKTETEEGIELCKRIKQGKPELPVIGFSIRPSEIVKERLKEAGACDHVGKPFDPEDLCKKIKQAISEARSSQAEVQQ